MVKIFCDLCNGDCDIVAYDLLIRPLHNFHPYHYADTCDPTMTEDKEVMRLVLCKRCYESLKLPNIYEIALGRPLPESPKEVQK